MDQKPTPPESVALPGKVYEVNQEGGELFKSPVRITIPYQEDLLPVNRTEEDIFAVFWYDGEWHRAYGAVDTQRNTITVETLHNGLWTWAVDQVDNAVAAIREYMGLPRREIKTVDEAYALVEEARLEYIAAWQTADYTVDTLEGYLDPRTVIKELSEVVVVEVVDAAAIGLGGKAAVVSIAGETVLAWGGGILTAIYVGKNLGWSVLTVEKVTRLHLATKKLQEARAILWVMEHPNAKTMPPHYAEALHRYCVSQSASVPTAIPEPSKGPALVDTWTRAADGMVMVYVRGGTFPMGSSESDPDALRNEFPQHTVAVEAFWVDRTEVSNAQYRLCIEAGVCQAPTSCDYGWPTYEDAAMGKYPVVCVSWHEARAYCDWVGARLPTEAEWEYAARGPQGYLYPWGNSFDCAGVNLASPGVCDDGYLGPSPVGSFPAGASWCAALDMAGNVYEWVEDWYDGYPGTTTSDKYFGTIYKVLRGGKWDGLEIDARTAIRAAGEPSNRSDNAGFRCVATR